MPNAEATQLAVNLRGGGAAAPGAASRRRDSESDSPESESDSPTINNFFFLYVETAHVVWHGLKSESRSYYGGKRPSDSES